MSAVGAAGPVSDEPSELCFEVTVAPGFAATAARQMVRHQLTRWPFILGYLLLIALVVSGLVTRVWFSAGLGAVIALVALVLAIRRISALTRALRVGGLTDGLSLAAEYRSDALTIRGQQRSGVVRYADVWQVHRYPSVVDLELRRGNVRHILPAELVPASVEARFPRKDQRR